MSKHKHRTRVGDRVAAPGGAIRGVDPFAILVVTHVHKDGTVDLEGENTHKTHKRVDPDALVPA